MNNIMDEDIQNPVDISQLSYISNKKQIDNLVRKTVNNSPQKGLQYVQSEVSALNNIPKPQDESVANNSTNMCPPQEVFNIQFLYDINQATE